MAVTVLVGTQFGDEGKGKVIDVLAPQFDVVVRFNGGANAGHTVTVGNEVYKLHLLPSGILHPHKRNLLSSNVAVDPEILAEELKGLAARGIPITPKQLGIDFRCPLVLPWHKLMDGAREEGAFRIGTTKKGIGPAYEDQAARTGLRFDDLLHPARFKKRLHESYELHHKVLEGGYHAILPQAFREKEVFDEYHALATSLSHFAADVSSEVHAAWKSGKNILFEGAQGTFLDNRFGTYPFVTASSCIAASAPLSAGVSPQSISNIVGVVKAYTTRVGDGPFPTELSGAQADALREKGGEYGTTTGRPRRVGWLDLNLLRYAARVNGLHGFHLTKLDVLSAMPELKVATHYQLHGKKISEFPASPIELEKAVPVYATMPSFTLPSTLPKSGFSALPKAAHDYVQLIEKEMGIPALSVSYGPGRDQILLR